MNLGNDSDQAIELGNDSNSATVTSDCAQVESSRPFTVVSRNIRGLGLHLDAVLANGNDVTALQETDVLESDVTWLRATAPKVTRSHLLQPPLSRTMASPGVVDVPLSS